jgi:hypothetical protein
MPKLYVKPRRLHAPLVRSFSKTPRKKGMTPEQRRERNNARRRERYWSNPEYYRLWVRTTLSSRMPVTAPLVGLNMFTRGVLMY